MKAEFAAWLVGWTQMFLMSDEYGTKWYETNGYYKFKKGDKIKLKSKCSCGYGIDPVGVIADIIQGEDCIGKLQDFYMISMERYDYKYYEDKGEAIGFIDWMKGKSLQKDHKRIVKSERHFKWNIEHHFRKVG